MTTRPALAIAAGIILAVFFTAGLLAPVLAPYDLEAMDLTARLLMPFESAAHILGTDELGRDIFSRLLYSIRMSFVLAVVGTLLGAVIGTLLGFLAARFGGIGSQKRHIQTRHNIKLAKRNFKICLMLYIAGRKPQAGILRDNPVKLTSGMRHRRIGKPLLKGLIFIRFKLVDHRIIFNRNPALYRLRLAGGQSE